MFEIVNLLFTKFEKMLYPVLLFSFLTPVFLGILTILAKCIKYLFLKNYDKFNP